MIFDNFGKATLVNDVHLLSNIYPLVFVIDPIVTCYRALHPINIPLLAEITNKEPEYSEAKRLYRFLTYFKSIPPEYVPSQSLLREFIGGSIFNV